MKGTGYETTQTRSPCCCHYLSQFNRDRVESYLRVYSNPAGSVEVESSRSATGICSVAPPPPISQLLILRRTKIPWGSRNYRQEKWAWVMVTGNAAGRAGVPKGGQRAGPLGLDCFSNKVVELSMKIGSSQKKEDGLTAFLG